LWAERYDRDLTDIFAVQDEITASVSAAILPTVARSERERAARKPPDSLDAWECYHRGMWHIAKIEAAENTVAQELFQRAIMLDPGFAAAEAALGLTFLYIAAFFSPEGARGDSVPKAAEHARRAILLDPADALGHGILAIALMMFGRHDEANSEADLAIALEPNSAVAQAYHGATRTYGGRPREAIASLEAAIRLSPFEPQIPVWRHFLARAFYWMGDYAAAVTVARQVCETYPDLRSAYRTLLAGLGQLGQAEEVQRVMAGVIDRFGERFQLRVMTSEVRREDSEHLREGYRKAGLMDD
jgi:adenylate cyclase